MFGPQTTRPLGDGPHLWTTGRRYVPIHNRILTETTCPNCERPVLFDIQFVYGERNHYAYTMGDRLRWNDKRREVGKEYTWRVLVDGISICELCNAPIGFDIIVEYDILKRV